MATSHFTAVESPDEGLLGPTCEQLQLRFVGGESAGQVFDLPSSKCTIGAAHNCTLRLPMDGVEATHALILHGARATAVRSLCPGVLVNGVPVREATLVNGDRLTVGPQDFEVLRPGRDVLQDSVASMADRADEDVALRTDENPTSHNGPSASALPRSGSDEQTELAAFRASEPHNEAHSDASEQAQSPVETTEHHERRDSELSDAQIRARVEELSQRVQTNTRLTEELRAGWQNQQQQLESQLSDNAAKFAQLDSRLSSLPSEAANALSSELTAATGGLRAAIDELRIQLGELRRQLEDQARSQSEDSERRSADWRNTDEKLQSLVRRIDDLRATRGPVDELPGSAYVAGAADAPEPAVEPVPTSFGEIGGTDGLGVEHFADPHTRDDLFDRLTQRLEADSSDIESFGAVSTPTLEPRSTPMPDASEDASSTSGFPTEDRPEIGDSFQPADRWESVFAGQPSGQEETPLAIPNLSDDGTVHTHEQDAPVTTADVLARLSMSGEWDQHESNVDAPLVTETLPHAGGPLTHEDEGQFGATGDDRASNEYASEQTSPMNHDANYPRDESDESIEAYMNQLLARVRGNKAEGAHEPDGIATQQPSVDCGPTIEDTDGESSEVDNEPLVEYQPRGESPQVVASLAAMRELANDSTRSAIAAHAKSSWMDMAKANLIGASAGIAGAVLSLLYLRTSVPMALLGITVGLAAAGWFSWRAIEVRRRLFGAPLATARSRDEELSETAGTDGDFDVEAESSTESE